MIKFHKNETGILLEYSSEQYGLNWFLEKINNNETHLLKRTFHLKGENIYNENEDIDSLKFIFAELHEDQFYRVSENILNIDFDLFFHKDVDISEKMFVAIKQISIFSKIEKILDKGIFKEGLYIGDPLKSSKINLPLSDFTELMRRFPNSYEIEKYVNARIEGCLKGFLNFSEDFEGKYERYLNKKIGSTRPRTLVGFKKAEKEKYNFILNKLQEMLNDQDQYTEAEWANEILGIIPILWPKYILVLNEVTIKNTEDQNKRLDYVLIDEKGYLDLIEIKKPCEKNIMSSSKYRDNYFPLKDLAGTVMQVEKYIFYLNKWGSKGEKVLTEKYREILPEGIKINIINPSGVIIMGRENKILEEQKKDFEILKRKYKNIADIITYDEIMNRLERLISVL